MQTMLVEGKTPQRMLTVDEVAERIGQSRWSVYRKVAAGQIPAVRLGEGRAALRIDERELNRWLYGENGED